jgi:hypothetical protein
VAADCKHTGNLPGLEEFGIGPDRAAPVPAVHPPGPCAPEQMVLPVAVFPGVDASDASDVSDGGIRYRANQDGP